MTWVDKNEQLVVKIRSYVNKFKDIKPEIFSFFQGNPKSVFPFTLNSEDGLRLLLIFSALNQDIDEHNLTEFLIKLQKRYSKRMFLLNEIKFDVLKSDVHEILSGKEWKLESKVPGILRSISDFFLIQGSLVDLIGHIKTSEELVEVLCRKIYFMGKTSIMKFKARYFIWLIMLAYPEITKRIWNSDSLLPVSKGASRFMYFIGPLKNKKGKVFTPQQKIEYFNRFYRFLFPETPWSVYMAFDSYREEEKNSFKCEIAISGCVECSVDDRCNIFREK